MITWNPRERSPKELDFTLRAIEKIAKEGEFLVSDIERNDVKFTGSQLILELKYVIEALKDPVCSWSKRKSDVVLDYYTLKAELYNLPFLDYISTPIIPINLGSTNAQNVQNFVSTDSIEFVKNQDTYRANLKISNSQEGAEVTIEPDGLKIKILQTLGYWPHDQSVASAVWTMNHPLKKFPSVVTTNLEGYELYGKVQYIDINTVQVRFSGPFSGYGYLN
jgi:hypothetical protein